MEVLGIISFSSFNSDGFYFVCLVFNNALINTHWIYNFIVHDFHFRKHRASGKIHSQTQERSHNTCLFAAETICTVSCFKMETFSYVVSMVLTNYMCFLLCDNAKILPLLSYKYRWWSTLSNIYKTEENFKSKCPVILFIIHKHF